MRFTESMPFWSCPSKYCAVNKIPQVRKDNRSAVRRDKSVIQCLRKRVTFYNELAVQGCKCDFFSQGTDSSGELAHFYDTALLGTALAPVMAVFLLDGSAQG